jgi:hypothetical protein
MNLSSIWIRIKQTPLLLALMAFVLLVLVHIGNQILAGWTHAVSLYSLGYAVLVDQLSDLLAPAIPSPTTRAIITPMVYGLIVFGFVYVVVGVVHPRPRLTTAVLWLALLGLVVLSIPLFPEQAFYPH